jgi:hypothetical protein
MKLKPRNWKRRTNEQTKALMAAYCTNSGSKRSKRIQGKIELIGLRIRTLG